MSVPYERLIQWLAGPLSVALGYVATQVVHTNISHQTALNVATFAVTTVVVYAGHHKWLTNLPKWWATTTTAVVPPPEAPPVVTKPPN